MRRVKPIRITIRSRPLVRFGTNLLLAALVLATAFAVDPSDTEWGLQRFAPAKYAPAFLATLALPFYWLGARGFPLATLPFLSVLSFAVFVIAGSVYTIFQYGAELSDSFLGRGLCALPFLPSYMAMYLPTEKRYLERRLAVVLVLAAVVMVVILGLWRLGVRMVDLKHIYHEQCVYFAAVVGAALADPWAMRRIALVVFFSLAAAATIKLTGFAFALIGIGAMFIVELRSRRRMRQPAAAARRLWVATVACATFASVATAAIVYQALLPSGSPGVRLVTYSERWELFQSSPLWGQLFVGSPIMRVGLSVLPSHSDTFDVMAFGGTLGLILFLLPCIVALKHAILSLPDYVARTARMELAATVFVASFLFELTFNPVLNQAKLALPFWFSVACLVVDWRIRAPERQVAMRDKRVVHGDRRRWPPVLEPGGGVPALK